MMKNKIFFLKLLTCFFLSALALCVFSIAVSADAPHIVDQAELLSDAEEAALQAKLSSLSDTLSQDLVIVTTNTLDNKNAKLYADDYFDDHGHGYGQDRSGVLLLIYIGSTYRECVVSTSGSAMRIFGDSEIDTLLDNVIAFAGRGDYEGACYAFCNTCEEIIESDGKLSPIWIVVSLLVGIAVASLMIFLMVSKHKGVKSQRSADTYLRKDTFRLDHSRDVFLYSNITRRAKPKSSSSGRSRSSSGRSHGGGSRRF